MNEHITPPKTYLLVFLALLAGTFLTTGMAFVDLGRFNVVVALTIAVIKMLLVVLFFMELRFSRTLTKVVVGGGVLWLAILISITMSDLVTRGWLHVPGK